MADELRGRRVAVLATDGVEQSELEQPRQTVEQAGGRADLVSIHSGSIQAMRQDINPAETFPVDREVTDCSADEYDALVLPGGTTNPDSLRGDSSAVAFVRDFVNQGKPVAAICHGPWTLVEAGVVRDRTMTSFPNLRTDLRNAGANVVDREVVVDKGLVTSRDPNDLPAFNAKLVEEFAEGKHTAGV